MTRRDSEQLVMQPVEHMPERAADAIQMLKALSHETRLLILCHLIDQELSVGQLNAVVKGSQSVISQHLAVLRRNGLVRTRRQAQTIYYSLPDARARRIIELLCELFRGT